MRPPQRRTPKQDTILLSGWLFADLLLALSIIFLVNNTSFHAQAKLTPTPTPTPSPTPSPQVVLATPTPVPRIKLAPLRIIINGNPGDSITNTVKQNVENDPRLRGQRVGLVTIYAGAPSDNDIGNAQQTDEQIKQALQSLNTNGFADASYYDRSDLTPSTDLYVLDEPSSFIILDIYLFV